MTELNQLNQGKKKSFQFLNTNNGGIRWMQQSCIEMPFESSSKFENTAATAVILESENKIMFHESKTKNFFRTGKPWWDRELRFRVGLGKLRFCNTRSLGDAKV